jgi:TRAP-type C4-dicarboxylate transport system substrate-binding protein
VTASRSRLAGPGPRGCACSPLKPYEILDDPFLFDSDQEAYTVLDGPIGQKPLETLPAHGLVGLG